MSAMAITNFPHILEVAAMSDGLNGGRCELSPLHVGSPRATALAKIDCHWILFGFVAYCGVSVQCLYQFLLSCGWHDVSVQGPAKS